MYDGVGSIPVPNPPLELENSEKIWNGLFQRWIWKWTAADRNSGKFFQIPKKIWNFSSVTTALYYVRGIVHVLLHTSMFTEHGD